MKYSPWESVASYLVDNPKERIQKGEFEAGGKLPSEKTLMEEYNVGRSSVREALKMLQAEHTIEIIKGKGSFVLSTELPSQKMNQWYRAKTQAFSDLVEIRVSLECLATRKATPKMTDEVIQKLISINDAYEATNINDVSSMLTYDEAFHRLIVKTADMELMDELYRTFEQNYAEYRIKGFIFTKYFKQAAEGHRRIIDAFRRQDAELAVEVTREHIYEVVEHIERILSISE